MGVEVTRASGRTVIVARSTDQAGIVFVYAAACGVGALVSEHAGRFASAGVLLVAIGVATALARQAVTLTEDEIVVRFQLLGYVTERRVPVASITGMDARNGTIRLRTTTGSVRIRVLHDGSSPSQHVASLVEQWLRDRGRLALGGPAEPPPGLGVRREGLIERIHAPADWGNMFLFVPIPTAILLVPVLLAVRALERTDPSRSSGVIVLAAWVLVAHVIGVVLALQWRPVIELSPGRGVMARAFGSRILRRRPGFDARTGVEVTPTSSGTWSVRSGSLAAGAPALTGLSLEQARWIASRIEHHCGITA